MLDSRDYEDRQFIAAVREYRALDRRRYHIIQLDRPIQRGWRRRYVLSEHAASRRDSQILEAILAVIGEVRMCHRPDFRQRRGRRKKLFEIEQSLRIIPNNEWVWKVYPDEWYRYFRHEMIPGWNGQKQPC